MLRKNFTRVIYILFCNFCVLYLSATPLGRGSAVQLDVPQHVAHERSSGFGSIRRSGHGRQVGVMKSRLNVRSASESEFFDATEVIKLPHSVVFPGHPERRGSIRGKSRASARRL